MYLADRLFASGSAGATFPKLVIHDALSCTRLGDKGAPSNYMILVPLFDLAFQNAFAAGGAGTPKRH
jgi:hypothetical protein